MIDPTQVIDFAVEAAKSSVKPIPSVHPGPSVEWETAGDTGKRTLWYVT